jgi:hypothetical protein
MKTFEEIRPVLAASHVRLIETLLSKGLSFAGSVRKDGGHVITMKATCGDIYIESSGQVELFTENINPYEQHDSGYHVWTLWPEDDTTEAEQIAGWITRITGDD